MHQRWAADGWGQGGVRLKEDPEDVGVVTVLPPAEEVVPDLACRGRARGRAMGGSAGQRGEGEGQSDGRECWLEGCGRGALWHAHQSGWPLRRWHLRIAALRCLQGSRCEYEHTPAGTCSCRVCMQYKLNSQAQF